MGREHSAAARDSEPADGARMRLLKAPKPDEPVVPRSCDTVIAVLSAQAIGRPLDDQVAKTEPLVIGADCPTPFLAPSIYNISGMSFGALCRWMVEDASCHR